uniref:Chloride channel protein n=1 Tax=Kwoniella dejecticola CBS 10117 TaxID=1296121 RepID=A0A1A6A0G5_9TREE|nr:voltage-gated chloride channel [Kwoniella dejecticola CBS 10117]OBR83562.1 voltage-gated chloride channel [Kwoniella dejecticola CBS 10117]
MTSLSRDTGEEQRMSTSASTTHSTQTIKPLRPPSISSLRQNRYYGSSSSSSTGGGPGPSSRSSLSHSRRQSLDIAETQPPSPITYFPNPSSFHSNSTAYPQPPSSSRSTPISTSPENSTFSMSNSIASSTFPEESDFEGPTPRMSLVNLDSAASSPRITRGGGNGNLEQRRRSSVAPPSSSQGIRQFSTPINGYGSTSNSGSSNAGLGLGRTPSMSTLNNPNQDAMLSSPRRISTSRVHPGAAPGTTSNRLTVTPPQGLLNLPTHEAYYSASQPGTATTSRFRDKDLLLSHPHPHSAIPHANSSNSHSRHLSVNSNFNNQIHSPLFPARHSLPQSPTGSVMRRIKRTASTIGMGFGRPDNYDDDASRGKVDDDEMLEDDEGERANGTRVWYSSYVTIDWIHDAIKDSSRVRRLRHAAHRSIRGKLANSWDRFQGWLVVTIIGILSAVIAFFIIRTEMALFDLKEGFCGSSWGTAKRFCCAPHHPSGGGDAGDEDNCGDWIEWGEFFAPHQKGGPQGQWIWGGPEFIAYGVVAVCLATLASFLTVYLSSSAHHTTSKDSTFLTPPSEHNDHNPKQAKQKAALNNNENANERQPLLEGIANEPITPLTEAFPSVEPPRKVMYYAAGSGIPEIKTILSGFVIHGYLGGWTLITKSVGLALSVASGLSLGKEGPLVHISSCVGNIVSRLFLKFECNEAKRREVLSAACAAGVSVAFGAPVGGVLFSLEEVSYYFPPKVMWRSFWCAAVAAITLKTLNPFGNGSLVLFNVTYTKEYHYWEYVIFVILGVFGGLYGAIFARLNIIWSREVRGGTWLKKHPIVEVALVTILTSGISFLNPYTRMGGTELVASLFEECQPSSSSSLCVNHPHEIASVIRTIGTALLIKGALTIITFGIKLPAGIFIPSLVVGACFGRIVGLSIEYIEYSYPTLAIFDVCRETDCIVPGLYAMVGAAATLAGVTRTTVSLAVIMFELTSTLNYVVPVMLGVLTAKTVADGLEKKGIYDLVIDLNQLPYLDQKHEYLWGSRRASSVADKTVPILRADKPHTVRSLTGKLLELVRLGMADTGFPILVKEKSCLRVVGFLGMNELEHALSELSDEPDATLNLMPDDASSHRRRSSAMSIFSFADSYADGQWSPYDLSRYIDRAPITVQLHSPLELVQQLFVKLGVRQIIVTNSRGVFQGIVTKKNWLNFLAELEEDGH